MSQTFQCPNCNAPLDYDGGDDPVIRCPYCGSAVVVPENLLGTRQTAGQQAFEPPGSISLGSDEPATAWEAISDRVSGALDRAGDMLEIVELARSGDEAAAVERYQREFGASPEQAQAIVEQIAQGSYAETPIVTVQAEEGSIPVGRAVKAAAGVAGGVSCLGLLMALGILLVVVVPVLIALASPGGPLAGVWARLNPFALARVVNSFGGSGSGAGLLDDPRAIAVNPDGEVYIAGYSDGRLQKFDPSGNFLLLWNIGAEQYVSNMAVDRAGYLYVVQRGDIWKYAPDGKLVGQVDVNIDRWFEAVATTLDGSLVAAVNSEDILRFDSAGQLVFDLGQSAAALTGQPDNVEDIAVDGIGNIYLLAGDDTVLKYSPEGRMLARFGSAGEEPGQFRAPDEIAVDGQSRIYVSDIRGIQVFAGDGRYLERIAVDGFAFGMAFNDQGELWVVTNKPQVLKYKLAGR